MLRRLLPLLLACLFAGLTVPAAASGPARPDLRSAVAEPCEAFEITDPQAVIARAEDATDVFVGRVRSAAAIEARRRDRTGGQENPSGLEPEASTTASDTGTVQTAAGRRGWRHTVEVEIGLRGETRTGDVVDVETQDAGDGGLGRLDEGRTYLFFAAASKGDGALAASRCGGTTLLADGLSARLRDQLERVLDPEPDPQPAAVELTEPEGGTDEPPSLTRATAPGVALGLVGILGLLLFSRAGRSG